MILFGLTGPHGAGKRTAVEYLETKGFVHFYVSDFLSEEARKQNREPNRVNRAHIANEFRARHPQALMEAAYAWGKERHPDAEKVVLEPQYTAAECAFVKEQGGVMIALECDLMTRYQRCKVRDQEDENMSFEEFRSRQFWEMGGDDPDAQNLAAAIECSNYVIDNGGSVEELHQKLDAFLQENHLV